MTRTCLIVDDSRVIRTVAQRILVDLGFTVTQAANGQEALNCCREAMPDVILLDWNMPVMDGIACLREIRRWPNGSVPRVVLCTNENDLAHIVQALQAGADEYIMKPFDREIVESKFMQVGML